MIFRKAAETEPMCSGVAMQKCVCGDDSKEKIYESEKDKPP
jgi:hypothetical protein